MMEFAKSLFTSKDNDPSMMRLAVFMILGTWCCGWMYVCLRSGSLPPVDWQSVAMVLGSLGWKVQQRKTETTDQCEEGEPTK